MNITLRIEIPYRGHGRCTKIYDVSVGKMVGKCVKTLLRAAYTYYYNVSG